MRSFLLILIRIGLVPLMSFDVEFPEVIQVSIGVLAPSASKHQEYVFMRYIDHAMPTPLERIRPDSTAFTYL